MRQRLIWGQGAGQAMEDAIVLVNCSNAYDFEKHYSVMIKNTSNMLQK